MSSTNLQKRTKRPLFHAIIAGYVLTGAQVHQWLCFRGMSQHEIDMYQGVQFPSMVHYYQHSEKDPPDVVPMVSKDQNGQVYTTANPMHYLLVGRMALVQNGAGNLFNKADLALNKQTANYLNHWVGDCFGETKLTYRVQPWPRDVRSFPLLTWKVEAEWNDRNRVGRYVQTASVTGGGSDSSPWDSDSEEKEVKPERFHPEIWMPVSWYLKGGVIVPPRE